MSNHPLQYRRNRSNPWVRNLVRDTHVSVDQMIQPLFAVEGIHDREEIPGLTGTFRDTPDTLLKQIESDLENGVRSFLLFGVPQTKSLRDFDSSFTAQQIETIKSQFGKDLFLAVDVCLCSYTSHGQCGILNDSMDHVENDQTVHALAKAALSYAQAGVDCVAPSDMMDHRIRAIRETLDENELHQTLIMSYSAKFHSGFYGPFRVAADSAPKGKIALKDRATYQIDPGNYKDALLSSIRDAEEGADILMVKPGMPYLDVLYRLSQEIPLPWSVYEVSGEFAAIEILHREGLMSRERGHVEAWMGFKRAGAQSIISYGSRYAREWIQRVLNQ